jgi:peptidoglycan hydrolase-like protein with peptidoglycan-binding domain
MRMSTEALKTKTDSDSPHGRRPAAARWALIATLSVAVSTLIPGPAGATPSPATPDSREGGVFIPTDPGKIDPAPRFGKRVLKVGMTGPDVKVLRSMVTSRTLGLRSIGVRNIFDDATHAAVRKFQARSGLKPNGIVNRKTSSRLIRAMPRNGASWYGAPLFGNNTACGQKFTPTIVGVAHKTLPCGTRVLIGYRGRFLLTRVIDRGPYTPGRTWDLSHAAMIALGYQGIDPVRHLIVGK